MKYKKVPSSLFLLTALTLVSFLAGCYSSVPVAENHENYTQTKLEATDHWRDIATDVAERVQKALHDRPDVLTKPIYIKAMNEQAFVLAFSDLLKTEIVSRGMLVATEYDSNCLLLEYNIQAVRFSEERLDTPVSNFTTSLGNIFTGNRYTDASNNEVLINAWITHNNRFLIHSTTIAYINDSDKKLYLSGSDSIANANSHTVRIVKR